MPDYQTFGVIMFVTLLPLGLVVAIWGGVRCVGILQTRLISLGWILMGMGALCFAATSQYAIHTSSKVTTQGSIYSLRKLNSGKNHSSYFYLMNGESTPQLSIDYAGARLQNGQQVSLTYLSNTTDVTDLQILSGPYSGWTIHLGDGTITNALSIGIGSVFVFFGLYWRHKYPHGSTPAKKVGKDQIESTSHEKSPLSLNDH